MMSGGDRERIKQIFADMQALAEKWPLELVYHQSIDGRIELRLGVVITVPPAPAEGEADGDQGEGG